MTRTNTLLIKTPEGVVFSQTLCGPVVRFLAWLVDFAITAALLIAFNIAMTFVSIVTPDFANTLAIFFYFAISVGYAMTLEWIWRGQTIGKRVLRLRVVDAHGLRLQFSQVAVRNLLRIVDLLPGLYVVGGLAALFTHKAQRLGDLAANTVVIRIPKIIEPNLDQLGADKYNSLRSYPHLCARLRQRVSPLEASTAVQAIVRRDEFEAVARVNLFSELAEHFKGKVEFPADALEGIADEQYVRNVVDVLYRADAKRPRQRSAAASTSERPHEDAALAR
jgi:uncharacterized RDD family membrane protein YckC